MRIVAHGEKTPGILQHAIKKYGDTMIWSTDSTVRAASVASLMAQCLATSRSRMPASLASTIPVPFSSCARVSLPFPQQGYAPTTHLNVDTRRPHVALVVRRVQSAEHLGRVESRALGERPRDNLKRLSVLLDGVLQDARRLLAVRHNPLNQLHLGRARTRHQPRVPRDRLDNIDTVVDRTLEVVEVVLGRAAQHNGRRLGRLILCRKSAAGTPDTHANDTTYLAGTR